MALSIRNPRTEQLARELATLSHESLTEAITKALEERLERLRCSRISQPLKEDLMTIARRCQALPTRDERCAEEIIGYNPYGGID